MKLLETYIQTYGIAVSDDILKVDAFLNHQIDPHLIMELASDFKKHFMDHQITKTLTIETSGIAPSVFLGYLLKVPIVYLQKDTLRILHNDLYTTNVHLYTKIEIIPFHVVNDI